MIRSAGNFSDFDPSQLCIFEQLSEHGRRAEHHRQPFFLECHAGGHGIETRRQIKRRAAEQRSQAELRKGPLHATSAERHKAGRLRRASVFSPIRPPGTASCGGSASRLWAAPWCRMCKSVRPRGRAMSRHLMGSGSTLSFREPTPIEPKLVTRLRPSRHAAWRGRWRAATRWSCRAHDARRNGRGSGRFRARKGVHSRAPAMRRGGQSQKNGDELPAVLANDHDTIAGAHSGLPSHACVSEMAEASWP